MVAIHPKLPAKAALQCAVLNLTVELDRKDTLLTKEDVFEVLNQLALSSDKCGNAVLIDAMKDYYLTQHENL